MDYSGIIGSFVFCQNQHGLHFGNVKSIDYDNIKLKPCVYLVPNSNISDENRCVEFFSLNMVTEKDLTYVSDVVGCLLITNVKELSTISGKTLEYYIGLFNIKL